MPRGVHVQVKVIMGQMWGGGYDGDLWCVDSALGPLGEASKELRRNKPERKAGENRGSRA
jgi:hypothetical protein